MCLALNIAIILCTICMYASDGAFVHAVFVHLCCFQQCLAMVRKSKCLVAHSTRLIISAGLQYTLKS